MSDHFDDGLDAPLRPDDALRRRLHDVVPEPPMDEVDWMALHARIGAAAQPTLAALTAARAAAGAGAATGVRSAGDAWTAEPARQTAGVWQPLAGWSPRGIPLAAAATVLLLLGAAWLGTAPAVESEAAGVDTTAFRTLEEEFVDGLGSGAGPLLAGIGTDELLDAVLFYGGEDW